MKKYVTFFALSAAMLAAPAMAMPGDVKAGADWTRAQAQAQAEAGFAKMDLNKDGKLDAADRRLRQDQRHEARFAALDVNKDGKVTKSEFDQARAVREDRLAERRADLVEQRAERAQRAGAAGKSATADAHKAGRGEHRFAGRGERHGMGHHGMRSGRGDRGAGAQAAVTQAEFVNQALARFDRLDGNKDGKVTSAERQAARAEMRAQRAELRAAKPAQ